MSEKINEYDSFIDLINKCEEETSKILEERNDIKNNLKKLKNIKKFLVSSFVLTCLIKFPKVYNYDYLLNCIAMIIEYMVWIDVDSKEFINEMKLDSTYFIQDFRTEVTLNATKQFLEDEKRKVLVKGK